MARIPIVAVLALIATWAFFLEYRPPLRKLTIPFDLEGYHYPLADSAFQALKQGRFPEWDPSQYCGLPFAANVQAALFYPPTWLLMAANWAYSRLHYQSLMDFVLLHVWLAFVLAYWWLLSRRLHPLAAALGAAAFAFSGYMMTQLQHLGLVCGLAWWPLAFHGIDRVADERRWRPAWQIAAASALVFCSGYTPFWVAFALITFGYAVSQLRWRAVAATIAAFGFSLLLAAVQLFPAREASLMMVRENRYGIGFQDPLFFITWVIPNYWDFGLDRPVETNPGLDYWYFGVVGLVGILFLVRFGGWRRAAPAWGAAAVTALFSLNPFRIVSSILDRPSVISQMIRDWYFLAGFTAAAALIAAVGLDAVLRRDRPARSGWPAALLASMMLAWSARLIVVARPGGVEFASGIATLFESSVGILLAAAAVLLFASQRGAARAALAVCLLALSFAEFQSFGAAKRFNATRDSLAPQLLAELFPALDAAAYQTLRRDPAARIALDRTGPFPTRLRHAALATPQGFDPFVPSQYRALIERYVPFSSDREFLLDHAPAELLALLGVRYALATGAESPLVAGRPGVRPVPPHTSYFKAWEFPENPPAYAWEAAGTARHTRWDAEHRVIQVDSPAGGVFRLSEQFYPGWSVSIDGKPAQLERCHLALQCIQVPPGPHTLEFRFRSGSLRLGAAVSLLSLTALALLLRRR